jgi:hypothetical protein
MFGIKFSPAKLRAIKTREDPGDVVLYTQNWLSIVVKAKVYMTSLGITYDIKYENSTIFQSLCAKLRKVATVLGR